MGSHRVAHRNEAFRDADAANARPTVMTKSLWGKKMCGRSRLHLNLALALHISR